MIFAFSTSFWNIENNNVWNVYLFNQVNQYYILRSQCYILILCTSESIIHIFFKKKLF